MWLFLKRKNIVNLKKTVCFRKRGCLHIHNCTEIFHTTNRKLCNTFLTVFCTKAKLSQDLLPDMKVVKKIFPTIVDMKNANKVQKRFLQNSKKDRMTHFNASVTVKRRRDDNNNIQRVTLILCKISTW